MRSFKEAVHAIWEAAWDRGDVDRLDEIMHPEYLLEHIDSGATSGPADLKREILELRAAFPDLQTTVEKILVDGDEFAIFWRTTGTFRGSLGDVPPTGTQMETRSAIQGVLREGRIARERVTWDIRDLLTDVGAPPLRSAFETDTAENGLAESAGQPGPEVLKQFNRQVVTGVTVVATNGSDRRPLGLAVNAYASVSLDPPLLLVCVQKTSTTYPALFQSTHLGISILGHTQRKIVETFASKNPDKFADVDWHTGPEGSPLIDASAACVEAAIRERFQAKTHAIFICRVTHAELSEHAPMLYKGGRFYDGASLQEI